MALALGAGDGRDPRTLAGATNVMLQSLTGLDRQAHAPGRKRIATLRHRLLAVPGRLICGYPPTSRACRPS